MTNQPQVVTLNDELKIAVKNLICKIHDVEDMEVAVHGIVMSIDIFKYIDGNAFTKPDKVQSPKNGEWGMFWDKPIYILPNVRRDYIGVIC